MASHWDFYRCRIEGALASVFVVLGLEESAPDASRPFLCWVRVAMNAPRADGLSSDEESSRLFQIEDAMEELFESRNDRYVGRITSSGSRTFFAYGASESGLAEAAAAALEAFPDYRSSIGSKDDPAWSGYLRTLLPTPDERQRMSNRRVVDALEKEGDSLRVRRRIDHWMYFPRGQDLGAVVQAVTAAGFALLGPPHDDGSSKPRPVSVQVHREDAADVDSIDECTLFLFRLAREHGGTYDGWESPVKKDGDA